jgi:hypothetical protein
MNATCTHPWTSVHEAIKGLRCTACGVDWPLTNGATQLYRWANEQFEEQNTRIEKLEAALFRHAGLDSCNRCGTFYAKHGKDGLVVAGDSVCVQCLDEWFENQADTEDDQGIVDATVEQLARWLLRHYSEGARNPSKAPRGICNIARLLSPQIRRLIATDGAQVQP